METHIALCTSNICTSNIKKCVQAHVKLQALDSCCTPPIQCGATAQAHTKQVHFSMHQMRRSTCSSRRSASHSLPAASASTKRAAASRRSSWRTCRERDSDNRHEVVP